MNLHFNCFEGSNREKIGSQQKELVLWWKVGKHAIWGERPCENLVKLSIYDGPMEYV